MFPEFPWTDELENLFYKKYGYSLLKNLYHLVLYSGEKSERVRIHYRQLLTELFINSFVLKIKKWCNKNKLKLTGHISPEEDIVNEGYFVGSLIELLENFDIPGTDIIIPAIGDKENKLLNRTMLMASSVADRKGVPALCECFGSSDWHFTPAKMKKITDWFFTLGINFVVPHAFFYSVDNLRKYEASPSQFYQWTFWKYYNYYSQYVSRLSFVMQNTKPVVKIAFLYPILTVWGILPDEKKAEKINDKLNDITFKLISNHFYFHFITEKHIKEGKIEEKGLKCGKVNYSIIFLLKETFISEDIKLKLKEIKKRGIDIIEIENSEQAIRYLKKKKLNNFKIKSSDKEKIFIIEKKKGDNSFYFAMNTCDKNIKAEIEFDGKTGIEKWDCENGKIFSFPVKFKKNKTILNLKFSPFQSILFSTSKNIFEQQKNEYLIKRYYFEDNWEVEKRENYFIINKWKVKKGGKLFIADIPSPVYKIFPELFDDKWEKTIFGKIPVGKTKKEKIEYSSFFYIEENNIEMQMIIEKGGIKGLYQIFLNGIRIEKFSRTNLYDVFNLKTEITPLLKKGKNEIKIELISNDIYAGIYSPIILKGDFSIEKKESIYEIRPFKKNVKTGSLISQGFPFFSGSLKYIQRVKIDSNLKNAKEVVLNFPDVKSTVEIKINGKKAGVLLWHPFKINIKEFLKEGYNLFEFLVTNSNMNLFRWKQEPFGIMETPFLEFLFEKV